MALTRALWTTSSASGMFDGPSARVSALIRLLTRVLDVDAQLEPDPAALSARIPQPDRVSKALAELSSADIAVNEFAVGQPTLDEVFLALTGHRVDSPDGQKEEAK
jgi:ABC-2 type transport system ATP-binding protein